MNKNIKHNFFWLILVILSFSSSVFLINEYQSNKTIAANEVSENLILQKEVIIDEDEYESKDFHIFKNITEIIDELFFF